MNALACVLEGELDAIPARRSAPGWSPGADPAASLGRTHPGALPEKVALELPKQAIHSGRRIFSPWEGERTGGAMWTSSALKVSLRMGADGYPWKSTEYRTTSESFKKAPPRPHGRTRRPD
jgi:hypothetical protein